VHANASRSKAVSYKRLLALETQLRAEVEQLFALAEQADEIALRQERLVRLAEAKQVLQARAQERQAAEQAEYEAKLRQREAKAQRTGHKLPGRPPTSPPAAEPQDKDQYNFTDPESRIMKNSNSAGFEQAYNAQVAVDQANFFIVACVLSNHPNAKAEVEPTLEALPAALGTPAAALDNGYERRTLPLWKSATSNPTSPLAANRIVRVGKNASPLSRSRRLRMPVRRSRWPPSYGPKSARPIQRLRKCTVEPVTPCTCHRRCKCRYHQSRAGLPAVLTAGPRPGRWRMVFGLSGLQSEAPRHVVHSLTAPRTKQSGGQRGIQPVKQHGGWQTTASTSCRPVVPPHARSFRPPQRLFLSETTLSPTDC